MNRWTAGPAQGVPPRATFPCTTPPTTSGRRTGPSLWLRCPLLLTSLPAGFQHSSLSLPAAQSGPSPLWSVLALVWPFSLPYSLPHSGNIPALLWLPMALT